MHNFLFIGILIMMVLHNSSEFELIDPKEEPDYEDMFNKIRIFDIPLHQSTKRMNSFKPRRGDPFSFGLGKRSQDPFAFGLGKRSYYLRNTGSKRDPYAFGLGK